MGAGRCRRLAQPQWLGDAVASGPSAEVVLYDEHRWGEANLGEAVIRAANDGINCAAHIKDEWWIVVLSEGEGRVCLRGANTEQLQGEDL